MSVAPIGGFSPMPFASAITGLGSISPAAGVDAARQSEGAGFGASLTNAVEQLNSTQKSADNLAIQAATGDLEDVHDYTIAASQAALMTELTVAVRNKAVEAFTEIMRMPV